MLLCTSFNECPKSEFIPFFFFLYTFHCFLLFPSIIEGATNKVFGCLREGVPKTRSLSALPKEPPEQGLSLPCWSKESPTRSLVALLSEHLTMCLVALSRESPTKSLIALLKESLGQGLFDYTTEGVPHTRSLVALLKESPEQGLWSPGRWSHPDKVFGCLAEGFPNY